MNENIHKNLPWIVEDNLFENSTIKTCFLIISHKKYFENCYFAVKDNIFRAPKFFIWRNKESSNRIFLIILSYISGVGSLVTWPGSFWVIRPLVDLAWPSIVFFTSKLQTSSSIPSEKIFCWSSLALEEFWYFILLIYVR